MNNVKQFFSRKPNTQVHDLLARVQDDFVKGKYGNATKCIVVVQKPDGADITVSYETCGLHLAEAVGYLEIAKKLVMRGI